MKFKCIASVLCLALAVGLFTGCGTKEEAADTIIYGTIYTANENGDFAEAAVIKDGKYIYVGTREGADKYIGEETNTVEAEFIMPSAVESHNHYILEEAFKQGLYINCYNDDWSYKSIDDMVSEIAAYRNEHPDAESIFGYGWSKLLVYSMGCSVTRQQIDAVIDDIPVYISGRDLHSGWCNTKCLELAGVLYDECPAEGVVRDENGVATGRVNDEACSYVRNAVFGEIEGYDEALESAQEILLSQGYTMLLDAWSNFDGTTSMYDAVKNADENGKLNMVVFQSYCVDTYDDYDEEISIASNLMKEYTGEHFSSKYIKLFADGTEEACTAYLLEPYSTGTYGTKNWETEDMKYVTKIANKAGLLVHTHAYGDASVRQVVDSYEYSDAENGENYRNSIGHAPYISDEDMQRIADLGIGICAAGNWATGSDPAWADYISAILGEERYKEYYFVDKFTRYGIKAGMSTDRPCADGFAEDVFDYIGVLTTGVDYREGYTYEAKRETWVTVEEAIKMMTINGAWSLDADELRGSIEVGKYADFIIADGNPFEAELSKINEINVSSTFFEGECVYMRYITK